MPAARTISKVQSPSPEAADSLSSKSKQHDDKLKRKRQSQSCDACRARKVRCARPDPPEGTTLDEDNNSPIPMTTGPDGTKQVAQCKHCIALGIKCAYDYQPKKRGPPNLYLRRLQEAEAQAAALGASGGSGAANGNNGSTPIVPSHPRNSSAANGSYFPSSSSSTSTTDSHRVVPSQGAAPGYGSTHSFMDTNTIPRPHASSFNEAGRPLSNLDTQMGLNNMGSNHFVPHTSPVSSTTAVSGIPGTLPSLPTLTNMSWCSTPPTNGNGSTNGHSSSLEASWLQQTHVPMHLQPSPARLSPILGHPSASVPASNGHIGGSAAGLSSLGSTTSSGGPIPPSRYPIAADLHGLSSSVHTSAKGPLAASTSVSTGNGNATNGPTVVKRSDTTSPASNGPSRASVNTIGQNFHGHYSQISTGSLPPYVHSRANSPVDDEDTPTTANGLDGSPMNGVMSNGLNNIPLTPTTAAEIFPQYPLYSWSMHYKEIEVPSSDPSQQQHVNSNLLHPPLSDFHRAHSLTTLAPMPLVMHILSLFFEYVYPLTPCVHKPSFYEGLRERREEKDPLFFALVCSTIASTLVQVPRSYLPTMERDEVRKLAKRFEEASRLVTISSYDPPSSTLVVIRYFDNVYHFCEGHDAASHAAFGEAAHIAITLHMHEEASYEGLDFIESEVRRRAFWLMFGADKSMSILLGRPICLRDEDCTLHFPREVDDEYITAHAIHPQPPGKTAIVSGLNYISRIFALLGEILVRIRVDKRSPPQGPFAIARLEEVRALHTRICAALAHAPLELRLGSKGRRDSTDMSENGSALRTTLNLPELHGAGFAQGALAELKEFFESPNANRDDASNLFLVMQANLYVTQQLVRFVIEQYRHELITLMREQGIDASQTTSLTAAAELARGGWTSEDREAVASDLLHILHSIPITSIATNGPSLVHKVRFVASTLLDSVRKADSAPASAARAHAYLWDFLSILSEIERNYLLADDRDVDFN